MGEKMKDGIIIVGYGTRKGNLEDILKSQAARVKELTEFDVGIAYYRVSSPTIPEAIEGMVKKGVDRIVLVPYFVADGTLTHELIPEKMGLAPNVYIGETVVSGKKVFLYLTKAFNFSTIITDIICDRIVQAGGSKDSGILILGHGSRDPTLMNRAVIERNTQRLISRGYVHTRFAFNEFCEPSIKDSISELVSQGIKDLVCIPLFIAMGLHLGDEIPEQIGIPPYSDGGNINVDGKDIKVVYTRPLEDDPRLADLVISKANEFLSD